MSSSDQLDFYTPEDRELILGKNALRIWKFPKELNAYANLTYRLLPAMALACMHLRAEGNVIMPPGAKPAGPYSPGILAGEFLYVSGQGAEGPDGRFPEMRGDQIRQCLDNMKPIVEAAGLTMEHVVYTQVYLTEYSDEDR